MDRRRLIIATLLIALAGAGAASWLAHRRPALEPAAAPPAEAPAASASSAPVIAGAAAGAAGSGEAAAQLEAVRTVEQFCDLVDTQRLWSAAALFATPRVWTRRQLRAVRACVFRSARVLRAPSHDTLTIAARVTVTATSGSPLRGGDDTLFFTLGRVGDPVGGWLIAAVTASP